MRTLQDVKLAVVGLGYVGLPLAVEFGKRLPVIGFDINRRRVDGLVSGFDQTLEVSAAELAEAAQLTYTADRAELGKANV
ncbi:MAG: Vi polysaccharide biosynthesis UDP-N-acetylglucosamine C-6 dehydrogenase TviB, partial [Achromobacter sp.]|nr:Vi polysaccharide biosynthesis UDP-N-acetylglucosamine C-6 dehydrogenase TviB [Achromobacter sp.]